MIKHTDLERAVWHKSTWSDGQGSCVSVARLGTHCAVRDSKNADRYFVVSLASWQAFVAAVQRDAFASTGARTRVFAPPRNSE